MHTADCLGDAMQCAIPEQLGRGEYSVLLLGKAEMTHRILRIRTKDFAIIAFLN